MHLGVSGFRPRCPEEDQFGAVRAGFEAAHRPLGDADGVPRHEIEHLIVKLEVSGAGNEDVDLLLLFVPVSERKAMVGAPIADS
jgi:hypothetical protein